MTNFILGDLISRLKIGTCGHLKSIKVLNTRLSIDILHLFYLNGVIRGYKIYNNNIIIVFLKYYKNNSVFLNIELVSTPAKKVYWTLDRLSLNYNLNNFAGFYIISTSKGLLTSNDCLLSGHISGKILLKVYI